MSNIVTKIVKIQNQIKELTKEEKKLEKRLERIREKRNKFQKQLNVVTNAFENINKVNKEESNNIQENLLVDKRYKEDFENN